MAHADTVPQPCRTYAVQAAVRTLGAGQLAQGSHALCALGTRRSLAYSMHRVPLQVAARAQRVR